MIVRANFHPGRKCQLKSPLIWNKKELLKDANFQSASTGSDWLSVSTSIQLEREGKERSENQ